MDIICPNSHFVWDGNTFSKCFDDIIFGFGANVVTIITISILGITQWNARRNLRINLVEKVFMHILPILGACLSVVDIILHLREKLHGQFVSYHEWLSHCSELAVWIIIILLSRCACFRYIFCHRILCFWWVVKSVMDIIHLQVTFSSVEVLKCLKESCIVLLDIMFGISINISRTKRVSSKSSSIEESLLSADEDLEEGCNRNSGNNQSYWDHMTFKSIDTVMNRGVIKQLDFEDLLCLPTDMDPSACHYKLLSCWQAQESNNETNPSLFRAICCAYGYPYICLGLLKVFNDCIGFAGPLLLNKLIKFLQQGSGNLDGYVLAIALGLTSILKSFFDTQYTFHRSKLKLKLRSLERISGSNLNIEFLLMCLYVSLAERSKFSDGEIQTFMSVDADQTVNLCNSSHDIWSLPFQIGVALYLLYTQVNFAFVLGLAITILLIPVNKRISTLIATATEKMMKQQDERIRRTGEIFTHSHFKDLWLGHIFSSWLMETRSLEVKYLDAFISTRRLSMKENGRLF